MLIIIISSSNYSTNAFQTSSTFLPLMFMYLILPQKMLKFVSLCGLLSPLSSENIKLIVVLLPPIDNNSTHMACLYLFT